MTDACPSCQAPVPDKAIQCERCGALLAAIPQRDPNLGQSIGNLLLMSTLGKGGMGTVYRAEHRSLKTPYAVKILHPQYSSNAMIAERFRREAVAGSQVRHENLVFVTDFGIDERLGIYIVMEYLRGFSLKQHLRHTGQFPVARLGRIGEQICDAIAAAHRFNIVHRDLKPDNVMILVDPTRPDFIKVLDFGVAQLRSAGREEQLTQSGLVMGTPAYMSPEQIKSRPGEVGPSTDIYALGVIFYEMLAGTPPFTGDSDFELLTKHMQVEPEPISAHRAPLAGTQMEVLLASMLEKRPERRPASMSDVQTLLAEAIYELQELGHEDAFYEPDQRGVPMPISTPPSGPATRSSPSIRLTTLIKKIRLESPDSAAAMLLCALPNVDSLKGEALSLALWGVLQQELLDAPIDTERFTQSSQHLGLLIKTILDSHKGPEPSASQEKIFRSLKNLIILANKERQAKLMEVLQPLVAHPLFPQEALPRWSARNSGTWRSIKSVMTKEIKIPWSEPGVAVPDAAPAQAGPASSPGQLREPTAEQPLPEDLPIDEPDEEPAGSLISKLKKPVSMGALKSVLTHDLFGSKKPKP